LIRGRKGGWREAWTGSRREEIGWAFEMMEEGQNSTYPKAIKRKVWAEGELKSTDWSNVILKRNSLYHNAI